MGVHYIRTKLKTLNPLLAIAIIAFGVMTLILGYQAMRAWTATTTTTDPTDIAHQREKRNVSHNGWQFEPYDIMLKA
jgi:hypothetical protein